jgi:hypothetical protein
MAVAAGSLPLSAFDIDTVLSSGVASFPLLLTGQLFFYILRNKTV